MNPVFGFLNISQDFFKTDFENKLDLNNLTYHIKLYIYLIPPFY